MLSVIVAMTQDTLGTCSSRFAKSYLYSGEKCCEYSKLNLALYCHYHMYTPNVCPSFYFLVCIYMHVYNSHTSQTLDIEVFQYDTEFRDEKSYSEI